uniref:Phosphate-selective porin O and P n=1 Tax=Uncultured bacterium HF130_AEPn_1 TaxID=663362 RepID=D0E8J5_UNCHF|nr:hypothetical protein ALOHA_HF130_AEPn_1_16c [uncultured bacterium HF130_AEPn_1]
MKAYKSIFIIFVCSLMAGHLDARPQHPITWKGENAEGHISGRIILDTVAMTGEESNVDNGELTDKKGFLLSNARLGFGLKLYKEYDLDIALDLAGKRKAGSRTYTYPKLAAASFGTELVGDYLYLKAGYQKIPGSLDHIVSSNTSQILSHHRTRFSLLMDSSKELGITLSGRYDLSDGADPIYVRYWYGAYNGEDIKLGRGNENDGFLLAGRLDFGMGAAPKETGVVMDDSFNVNLGAYGSLQDGMSTDDQNFGADFRLSISKLALYANWQYQKSETKEGVDGAKTAAFPGKWERRFWNVQLSYLALMDIFEPIVVYSMVDDNIGLDNVGDQTQIYAGLNIYFEEHLSKLQIAYLKTDEKEGFERKNDQAVIRFQLAF